jgi:hypothetical protein
MAPVTCWQQAAMPVDDQHMRPITARSGTEEDEEHRRRGVPRVVKPAVPQPGGGEPGEAATQRA